MAAGSTYVATARGRMAWLCASSDVSAVSGASAVLDARGPELVVVRLDDAGARVVELAGEAVPSSDVRVVGTWRGQSIGEVADQLDLDPLEVRHALALALRALRVEQAVAVAIDRVERGRCVQCGT